MTKVKVVNGLKSNGFMIMPTQITLRVTINEDGKSLSLGDDKKVLLMILLEAVKDIIVPVGSLEVETHAN